MIRLLQDIYDEVRVCKSNLIQKMIAQFQSEAITTELQIVLQAKLADEQK